MHGSTHMGTRKMEDLIRHAKITIKDSRAKIEQTVTSCRACQLTNASAHGSNPDYWEVDFTEVKPGKYGYRYLLVFVDTFSGRTEAFPTKHKMAQIMTKKLLEDIVLAEFDDHRLLFSLQMLQRTHEQVWPKLRALYETGPPPDPHRYRPGDWVYVRRYQHQTLQPLWKGPYLLILTTPTTLKVDRITPWAHYTHVQPADPHSILKDFVPEWKSQPDKDNPLKLRLSRSHLFPTSKTP
ncbi:unnamed protein product [Nyctereutes procyonoides]|uniref:(raccoon dog) hypothetical protein n=1 Tax=Nyctereutes procyonoides TaxID=34880 RepID=A0A811YHC7_NYCPR|nr:unnamed protein product [Nyctereutes procyonoides]